MSSNTDQSSPLNAQRAERQKWNVTDPENIFSIQRRIKRTNLARQRLPAEKSDFFRGSLARAAAGSSRRLEELARRHGCLGACCPAAAVRSRGSRRENWAGNNANTNSPKNKDLSLISRDFRNHQEAQNVTPQRVKLSKTLLLYFWAASTLVEHQSQK